MVTISPSTISKFYNVIDSCNNLDQLEVAQSWIDEFMIKTYNKTYDEKRDKLPGVWYSLNMFIDNKSQKMKEKFHSKDNEEIIKLVYNEFDQ